MFSGSKGMRRRSCITFRKRTVFLGGLGHQRYQSVRIAPLGKEFAAVDVAVRVQGCVGVGQGLKASGQSHVGIWCRIVRGPLVVADAFRAVPGGERGCWRGGAIPGAAFLVETLATALQRRPHLENSGEGWSMVS